MDSWNMSKEPGLDDMTESECLEADLEILNKDYVQVLIDLEKRDERIAELERQLAEKDKEIERLREEIRQVENENMAMMVDKL